MTIKNKILSALCNDGSASRAELSKKYNLSSSHVSEAVNDLLDKGILIESGYRAGEFTRGRKNTLLDLNTARNFALGIGSAKGIVSIGLTTVKGDVLGKSVIYVDESAISREAVFERALAEIVRILKNCCLTHNDILGIGLCISSEASSAFYGHSDSQYLVKHAKDFTSKPVCHEAADEYLAYSDQISSIKPEELFIFGAAKVIREMLIYGNL